MLQKNIHIFVVRVCVCICVFFIQEILMNNTNKIKTNSKKHSRLSNVICKVHRNTTDLSQDLRLKELNNHKNKIPRLFECVQSRHATRKIVWEPKYIPTFIWACNSKKWIEKPALMPIFTSVTCFSYNRLKITKFRTNSKFLFSITREQIWSSKSNICSLQYSLSTFMWSNISKSGGCRNYNNNDQKFNNENHHLQQPKKREK